MHIYNKIFLKKPLKDFKHLNLFRSHTIPLYKNDTHPNYLLQN